MTDGNFTRIDRERGRILVVEPDPLMMTAISACLDQQGHHVTMAKSESIAKTAIQDGSFDLLLLAIESTEEGCNLSSALRASPATEQLPVIYMMAKLSDENLSRLRVHGGVFCLQTPFEPETLVDLVQRAMWMPHVAQSKLAGAGKEDGNSKHSQQAYRDWVSL